MGTFCCCGFATASHCHFCLCNKCALLNLEPTGALTILPGEFISLTAVYCCSCELCILAVSFLSPYSQKASVWGRDTQEKHETCKVPCHEEFGWLISCSWVFGSLLEVCGLWVWSAAPQSVGWSLGEGDFFPLQKGNSHLGAPGRAALAQPVSKSHSCIWMGEVEEGSSMTHWSYQRPEVGCKL